MAGEILGASEAYELRYRMLITAPQDLETATEHAFDCLRRLRDCIEEPKTSRDARWDVALTAIDDAMVALRQAMTEELSTSARTTRH